MYNTRFSIFLVILSFSCFVSASTIGVDLGHVVNTFVTYAGRSNPGQILKPELFEAICGDARYKRDVALHLAAVGVITPRNVTGMQAYLSNNFMRTFLCKYRIDVANYFLLTGHQNDHAWGSAFEVAYERDEGFRNYFWTIQTDGDREKKFVEGYQYLNFIIPESRSFILFNNGFRNSSDVRIATEFLLFDQTVGSDSRSERITFRPLIEPE